MNSEDKQSKNHHMPAWFSLEKEIIEPSVLSDQLGVDTAIVSPIAEFYDHLIDSMGMGDADDAPSFNGSIKGKIDEERAVYLSAVGAPSAGMLLETLIASGIQKTVMLGYAGSISDSCRIGDLAIPVWGIREEGTSYHYLESEVVPEVSESLVQTLRDALDGISFVEGGVWTTDAPYRETLSKARDYARAGAIAVEMECTALMSIAMYRKAEFASLLVISDEIFEGRWRPGFDAESVQRSVAIACDAMGRSF